MNLKITCLGVGNGTSHILRGNPSSSFVISKDGKPYLLVDCGLGTARQYQKYIGNQPPKYLYISHNHIDHSGELPVLLLNYYKNKHKVTVFGHSKVVEMLKSYRLQELSYVGIDLNVIANWKTQDYKSTIELGKGEVLELKKSKHSYPCYGFRLKINEKIVLGYGGDSGFDKDLYDFISESEVIILDGREVGNAEHASVDEISNYYKTSNKSIYIIHHDSTMEMKTGAKIIYLEAGSEILFKNG